jgi:hypothetical protein
MSTPKIYERISNTHMADNNLRILVRDSQELKHALSDPKETRLALMRSNLAALEAMQLSIPDKDWSHFVWCRFEVAIKSLKVDIDAVRLDCVRPNSSVADIIAGRNTLNTSIDVMDNNLYAD